MIGIVLVSHSHALAEGARELGLTLAGADAPIAAAGGLDGPDHLLGTDPMRILSAIDSVYSDDGVIVFVDMGSALLSADMALQMLDPERQPHVLISDAPFVEGTIIAAVEAHMELPLSQILEDLKSALKPKQDQLAGR